MRRKEEILRLLQENGPMTQGDLSVAIYGDNKHMPNIYGALMSLVNSGVVVRTGSRPSLYSLSNRESTAVEAHNNSRTIERVDSGNVILLNKPFLGGWFNNKENIGHEVIDFLKTDDGDYYVYNNPWGVCPDNIWVEGTSGLRRMRREKYIGKYMVLTSESRGHDFDILYVIKLSEKLHRFHTTKDEDKTRFRNNQSEVVHIMRERNIRYNNKTLDEIYTDEDSLYLTFKAECIWKADNPILVQGLEYNFQRNKGYIYDDKFSSDYESLINLIEESVNNGSLQPFVPRSVDAEHIGELNSNRTFLDLINMDDNEQVFTDMLHSLLEQGDLLKHFCERFRCGRPFDSNGTFKVFRETKVVDGRMDVCAESNNQRIIIENKVYSGLNGLKPADNETQLSTYYRWGIEKGMEPLCMVVAPNFRVSEITHEIAEKDPTMVDVYNIKTYGDIADFLTDEYNEGSIPASYTYYGLIPQIINAFRNLSYSTKEDLYARMFLDASN